MGMSCSLNLLTLNPVYSDNFDPISSPHAVHIVIIGQNCHRRWNISSGNTFGGLLKLNGLPVCESTQIVDKLEGFLGFASSAFSWLLHFSILQRNRDLGLAVCALEQGYLHLGAYLGTAEDDSSEADELVDVLVAYIAHADNIFVA